MEPTPPSDVKSIVVQTAPSYVRPYILRNLYGEALQLGDDVFRILASNASTGGAFTLLGTNGQINQAVPTHYHTHFYETFFCFKGRVRLWVGDEARELLPGDFGAVPHNQIHSYQFLEPDTQLTGFLQPGGFEALFKNISTPYTSKTGAPFPPDQPLPFPIQAFMQVASSFDVHSVSVRLNDNLVNGSTNDNWHDSTNALPGTPLIPYYIASNWGPKYLKRSLGQVIAPRATLAETGGNFTIATVTLRHRFHGEQISSFQFPVHQVFQVLEGQLSVQISERSYNLIGGDVVFIPAGTAFQYWSDVRFTKFYIGAAGYGLDSWLISQSIPWDYAVFPAYA
jgi:quercetin dioxygenase-like cupin family protein